MSELLLTIDTSTPAGSVALSRGDVLLGEVLVNVKINHTDHLLEMVKQLMDDSGCRMQDVDGFGVVLGPGSFTGLRVGVATVKGLALATGKPVVGVSSLHVLAMQAPFSAYPVCTVLDARKKEVYAGFYRWKVGEPVSLMEEAVLPPEDLLQKLEGEILFIGNGSLVYRTLIVRQMGSRAHFAPWPLHFPKASSAAVLALAELRQNKVIPMEKLVPRYIRLSEAEIMMACRHEEGSIGY